MLLELLDPRRLDLIIDEDLARQLQKRECPQATSVPNVSDTEANSEMWKRKKTAKHDTETRYIFIMTDKRISILTTA